MLYGSQAMTASLRRVLMRRPGVSLANASAEEWHYGPTFDGTQAVREYGRFAELVADSGAEILWLDDDGDGLADAMFTHDPSLMSEHGAVILRMGKTGRMNEPELHRQIYLTHDIPVLGEIVAPGTVEGGDCIWVDRQTLAVGRGVRTNQTGIQQLTEILAPIDVTVIGFDLPLGHGADACLHLMSVVSPLADDLALIFAPMLPVSFWQLLTERNIALLEAPEREFIESNGLNLNVLPTSPRNVIMIEGFPVTRKLMEDAGCDVSTFEAHALCMACEGGPTCLTRPILRS